MPKQKQKEWGKKEKNTLTNDCFEFQIAKISECHIIEPHEEVITFLIDIYFIIFQIS